MRSNLVQAVIYAYNQCDVCGKENVWCEEIRVEMTTYRFKKMCNKCDTIISRKCRLNNYKPKTDKHFNKAIRLMYNKRKLFISFKLFKRNLIKLLNL